MNFAMSSNAPIAAGILAKINLQFDSKRFAYPAGGMFLARTKSLKPLLELKWTADDFPAELSQMDGTTQHALERLVGLVPSLTGFSHLIFDSQENSFTLDESFVEDANLSRKNVSSE
jgi:lipopolysaccharide biosynthesis protein